MSQYAVLGATGNCGSSLIKILLQSSDIRINTFCRSEQKLRKLVPEIEQEGSNIRVFQGGLDDIATLSDCIAGTRAVFLAIAQSDNVPGCTIAQDTAHAVLSAFSKLKEQWERNESQPWTPPRLVVLSSSSTEPQLEREIPYYLRQMLHCACSYIYADLEKAEKILRANKDLIPSITFVKPGAVSHDTQKGHELNQDVAKSPVSWLDLAAGMVEIAGSSDGKLDMKYVAVNSTAKHVAFPWDSPVGLVRGLLFHFLPWTYGYLG